MIYSTCVNPTKVERKWTAGGAKWTVGGEEWTVGGAKWTVGGTKWTEVGPKWTVGGEVAATETTTKQSHSVSL